MVVGRAARPTVRGELYCSGVKARMRAAEVRRAAWSSARTAFAGCVWIEFGAEGGELSCVKLGAFGVAEQAVEAAGDVADVEGYGREAEWVGVDFRASEVGAPFGDVFFGEFERMEDGTLDGIDFGEGAAEPGFWLSCRA